MADFNGTILTDKGRNLLAKALTGTELKFTKVSLGDGVWNESVNPESLTELVSKKMDLAINELDVTGDGTARLRFVLTNTGLSEGFFTREIGIYANDPDEGEILYAVTYSKNPDFIPADGVVKIENVTDIYTIVSNAQNVEAVISDTVVIATKDDVNALKTDLESGNITVFNAKNTSLLRGKKWFDLSRHKKICKFDVESEAGKGNLQGICVVDGYLYAHRNIKDNDAGIPSYSPDEKGRIYKFDLEGNLILKTNDLPKVVHQGFSYFKDKNGQFFVCSGGTDDGETETTIKNYIYEDITKYLNAGKKISVIKWNDTTEPEVNLYRVMDNYDENNEKNTLWCHAVPYVDAETLKTVIVFTDPKNTRRKLVRIYNSIQDIIQGNYNSYTKQFIVAIDKDVDSYFNFQGVSYKNGLIYILLGTATMKRNKLIKIYTEEGALINEIKFMPNFVNLSDYEFVEPEGIVFDNKNNIYIGLHLKNTNGTYEEYLVQLDEGSPAIQILENIPYRDYTSSDINHFNTAGNWYRVWNWDEETNSAKNLISITDYGNPRFGGTYIGLMYNPENSKEFNKFVSYHTNYDILQLRAWNDLNTGGAGINLYKTGGNSSNPGGIKFFKADDSNYIFDNLPTENPEVAGAIWNDNGTLKVSAG